MERGGGARDGEEVINENGQSCRGKYFYFHTQMDISKLKPMPGGWPQASGKDGRVCVFITARPITKLCVWGEEDSGGHVL